MDERYEDKYECARRYYLGGETMEAIAHEMGVSRSTVSRLLASARAEGIVRISLAEPRGARSHAARQVADAFGVRVHLVEVGDAAPANARFSAVAERGAEVLNTVVGDDTRLGVAWGVTVSALARALTPLPLSGVRVVQLNGSTFTQTSGMPYVSAILQTFADAYSGSVVPFPVPAFFDHVETRTALWREGVVQRVLAEIARLDVALFGVGCLYGRVPSHVYSSGAITPADLAAAQQAGAVGDVATVLLREDGTWRGIPVNERATGATPDDLARIPRRLCVVGDPSRARAVVGALRAGVATDLVCDDVTLRYVARLL